MNKDIGASVKALRLENKLTLKGFKVKRQVFQQVFFLS